MAVGYLLSLKGNGGIINGKKLIVVGITVHFINGLQSNSNRIKFLECLNLPITTNFYADFNYFFFFLEKKRVV